MVFDHESGLEYDPFAANHHAWGDVLFDGLTPSIGDSNPGSYEGTRYIATEGQLESQHVRTTTDTHALQRGCRGFDSHQLHSYKRVWLRLASNHDPDCRIRSDLVSA